VGLRRAATTSAQRVPGVQRSANPWLESYYPAAGRVGYHPNEAGMKAAAALVETALGASDQARKAVFSSGIAGKCLDVRSSNPTNGTCAALHLQRHNRAAVDLHAR
jgi:hypothetical protein